MVKIRQAFRYTLLFAFGLAMVYIWTTQFYVLTPVVNFNIWNRRKAHDQKDGKRVVNINNGAYFCQAKSPWAEEAIKQQLTSDMKDWTFNRRINCPPFEIGNISAKRRQIILHCNPSNPYMSTTIRNTSDKIEQIKFGEKCLIDVIDKCCYDENKVPNVVHFVWYVSKEVGYFHYLSLTSLLRFMKPCLILIHGPAIPFGKYWDSLISTTPNVIHVQRETPQSIFGHRLAYKEHASDIMRIQALQKYGGIYVDFDEVLLRSLDPLRKYEYTQGHEFTNNLGSQLVMAAKNATFLTHWLNSYRDNYKGTWGHNALDEPWRIAQRHPELIHVEGHNFTRPDWYHRDLILDKNCDWSTNNAMHLYIRHFKGPIDVKIMRTLNTTIGAVSRHILLGNKELCEK